MNCGSRRQHKPYPGTILRELLAQRLKIRRVVAMQFFEIQYELMATAGQSFAQVWRTAFTRPDSVAEDQPTRTGSAR